MKCLHRLRSIHKHVRKELEWPYSSFQKTIPIFFPPTFFNFFNEFYDYNLVTKKLSLYKQLSILRNQGIAHIVLFHHYMSADTTLVNYSIRLKIIMKYHNQAGIKLHSNDKEFLHFTHYLMLNYTFHMVNLNNSMIDIILRSFNSSLVVNIRR